MEEAAVGRPNAVAEVGRDKGQTLMFCAHLDTVGTAGMTIPPFEPKTEGRRVFGRGSYDMKGSAAAVMSAAEQDAQKRFRVQCRASKARVPNLVGCTVQVTWIIISRRIKARPENAVLPQLNTI